MVVKPEQDRVRNLLTDTVTLLCKNGLTYGKEMKVQGLLGITLDEDEVFVVHFNEKFDDSVTGKELPTLEFPESDSVDQDAGQNSEGPSSSKKRRKRRPSRDSDDGNAANPKRNNQDTFSQDSLLDTGAIKVKQEPQSGDVICVEDSIKADPLRDSNQLYGGSHADNALQQQQSPFGMIPNTGGGASQMSDNSNTSWDASSLNNFHQTPGGTGMPGTSGSPWGSAAASGDASSVGDLNLLAIVVSLILN